MLFRSIELWDDGIYSIRLVNPYSQRAVETIDSIRILPMDESIEDLKNPEENQVMLFDYINPETLIILDEPVKVKAQCERVGLEFERSIKDRLEREEINSKQIGSIFRYEEIVKATQKYSVFMMMNLEQEIEDYHVGYKTNIRVYENTNFYKNFDLLEKDFSKWKKEKKRIILFAGVKARGERLVDELDERGIVATYSHDLQDVILPGSVDRKSVV